MEPERRSRRRTTPEELSYIRFEPEGGGLVLNASEDGLAFHAAEPIRQSGTIQLSVSPNPEHRIEMLAEIAWMDKARKSGGLRLIEVQEETRDQIRRWLRQGSESQTQQMDFGPPERVNYQAPVLSLPAREHVPLQLPPAVASPRVPHVHASFTAKSVPRTISASPSALFPELSSPARHDLYGHPRWLRGTATVFLVLAFALMPFLFLQSLRSEFGNTLISIGEKLKGAIKAQAEPEPVASTSSAPSAQAATANSQEASAPPPLEAKPDAAESAGSVAVPPDSAAAAQVEPEKVMPAGPSHVEHEAGKQPHKEVHERAGRSTLVSELWSEVETGNSKAEVALARLYLTGDGVPRNCEQARVLLRAAIKKGSVEAQQEYRKLKSAGCR